MIWVAVVKCARSRRYFWVKCVVEPLIEMILCKWATYWKCRYVNRTNTQSYGVPWKLMCNDCWLFVLYPLYLRQPLVNSSESIKGVRLKNFNWNYFPTQWRTRKSSLFGRLYWVSLQVWYTGTSPLLILNAIFRVPNKISCFMFLNDDAAFNIDLTLVIFLASQNDSVVCRLHVKLDAESSDGQDGNADAL